MLNKGNQREENGGKEIKRKEIQGKEESTEKGLKQKKESTQKTDLVIFKLEQ